MTIKQAEIPNDRSMDEMRNQVVVALAKKFLLPANAPNPFWVRELYPDRAIVSMADNSLQSFPYTVTAAGVDLGAPTAVEMEFVPAAAAAQASAIAPAHPTDAGTSADHERGDVRMLQAVDKEGWEWEVLLIKPGLGGNNQYFPPDTLRQATSLFEGAKVFCLDHAQHVKKTDDDKSARQIVGWTKQPRYIEGEGIKGRLHLVPTADWLRQNLIDASAMGQPDLYGLSIDAPCCRAVMKQIHHQGRPITVQWFTQIEANPIPPTVDVVWNPGTPGGFQRALNARFADSPTTEEERMKEKLLAILQAKRPDLHKTIADPAAATEEQVMALLDKAMTEPAPAQAQQAAALSEDDKAVIRQAKVQLWNGQVREQLIDCKLPERMQQAIRTRFMDKPLDGSIEPVKQAVQEQREILDALSKDGQVQGLGIPHEVTIESEPERLQQALDKMFGCEVKGDVPAFVSLRQAYVRITGDQEVSGLRGHAADHMQKMGQAVRAMQAKAVDSMGYPLAGHVRATQAQLTSTWPLLLGNSLYRRLRMAYGEVEYSEGRIISTRKRANDYRTIEAMTPHYSGDIPTVAENADYTELAALSEEGVNYKVTKRGRIITISRETIINDDLSAVVRMISNEGRAARRTFARTVWNLLINNATFDGDAVAVFHASHNNLGSTAMTANAAGVAAIVAALNRLMNQTEPGSGEKLGGSWWSSRPILAVPNALQDIAKQLNQSNGIPGAANQGDNPIYGLFGSEDNPERIIVNPLFTDVTDWYAFRQPTDTETIEVAFLFGQEQPEVFVADNQAVGQMFVADKQQYKLRHEYGAEVVDFRGMDKSVVAG